MTSEPTQPAPGEAEPGRIAIAPGVHVPGAVLDFSYARSGGPGGQNVNKVASKAQLRVRVADLPLPSRVRTRLRRLAGSRLVGEGDEAEVLITSESERSQRRNRDECLARLRELIVKAQAVPKPRKKTRPGKGAIERRLKAKRELSEKKERRRGSGPNP